MEGELFLIANTVDRLINNRFPEIETMLYATMRQHVYNISDHTFFGCHTVYGCIMVVVNKGVLTKEDLNSIDLFCIEQDIDYELNDLEFKTENDMIQLHSDNPETIALNKIHDFYYLNMRFPIEEIISDKVLICEDDQSLNG